MSRGGLCLDGFMSEGAFVRAPRKLEPTEPMTSLSSIGHLWVTPPHQNKMSAIGKYEI